MKKKISQISQKIIHTSFRSNQASEQETETQRVPGCWGRGGSQQKRSLAKTQLLLGLPGDCDGDGYADGDDGGDVDDGVDDGDDDYVDDGDEWMMCQG